KVIENNRYAPDITKKYTVADMITGYGVAEAVRHYYEIYGGDVKGKRTVVQGFGNVGGAAAFFLAQMGATVVGIMDVSGGVIQQEGLSFEEIKALFLNKKGNALVHDKLLSFDEVNKKIWDLKAEVFAPCAATRLITKEQITRLM